MILGIGVDLTNITEINRLISDEKSGEVFVTHTFTMKEQAESKFKENRALYFAERFAAKEAVFKALGNVLEESFDFRKVETLDNAEGYPEVNLSGELEKYYKDSKVSAIHVNISNENDHAMAFVIGEAEE